MSFVRTSTKVLRHPNGLYLQEWGNTVNGVYTVTRVELVPKAQASSYKLTREMQGALAFFPGVDIQKEVR